MKSNFLQPVGGYSGTVRVAEPRGGGTRTHFLENVIDANSYPLPEITDLANRIRRIGLGVMGLADAFIRLGIPYDSAEAVEMGRKLQAFVDDEAKVESERLATIRGVFPEWEKSIWGPDKTCARDAQGQRIRPMRKLRNCKPRVWRSACMACPRIPRWAG